jgi:hypothetical protein
MFTCHYSLFPIRIFLYLRTLYSTRNDRQIFPILTARLKNSKYFRSISNRLRSKSVALRLRSRSRQYRPTSSSDVLVAFAQYQIHREPFALWSHRRWCARRTLVTAIAPFAPFVQLVLVLRTIQSNFPYTFLLRRLASKDPVLAPQSNSDCSLTSHRSL